MNNKLILNNKKRIGRGFLGIILSLFVFNLFFAIILNIDSEIKKLKNKNFIMAELQADVSKEKEEILEQKFLNLKEVTSVIYVDNYTALNNLQKDLEIVIPRGNGNPLPNTFRIYFNDVNNLEKLQTILESTKEIKNFLYDETYVQQLKNRLKIFQIIEIFCVIVSLYSLFILNTILKFQLEEDYLINVIEDESNPRNRIKAKNVNVLPSTLAILIGTVLFFNFYIVIRNYLVHNSSVTINILSLLQVLKLHIVIALAMIIYVWIMPVKKDEKVEKNYIH